MPLANLGLVTPADVRDPPDRLHAPMHHLRCVAGFYSTGNDADAVAKSLVQRFGLRSEQVAVIHPAGLTPAGLRAHARRWQTVRPRTTRLPSSDSLLTGVLAGLVTCGLAAALAGALASLGDSGIDAGVWILLGGSAGALAGAAATVAAHWRQPPKRFDGTVARRLAAGHSVVVAHSLAEDQEAPVLARLQSSSHSWCAEAPCLALRSHGHRRLAASA